MTAHHARHRLAAVVAMDRVLTSPTPRPAIGRWRLDVPEWAITGANAGRQSARLIEAARAFASGAFASGAGYRGCV